MLQKRITCEADKERNLTENEKSLSPIENLISEILRVCDEKFGILIYFNVKNTKYVSIDIRKIQRSTGTLLEDIIETKDIEITEDELDDIKNDLLKECFLFSGQRYADVLILEIVKN